MINRFQLIISVSTVLAHHYQEYQADAPYAQRSDQDPMDVDAVHNTVLNKSGARPADRDSVDHRVIKSVVDRDGQIINSQKEVGGWPHLAENVRSLNMPSDKDGGDGYTNLEEWLHAFAAKLEGGDMQDNNVEAPMNLSSLENDKLFP